MTKDQFKEIINKLHREPEFPDYPDQDTWYRGYNQALADIWQEFQLKEEQQEFDGPFDPSIENLFAYAMLEGLEKSLN